MANSVGYHESEDKLSAEVKDFRLGLEISVIQAFADKIVRLLKVRDPLSERVHLGPTEFRLLRFLLARPERVHSRTQLLDHVWGDHVYIEERTVDVHIRRLRQALEPYGQDGLVETVRGSGYRLSAPR